MGYYLAQTCVVLMTIYSCYAYPLGPPVGANPEICYTMMPNHGAAAQNTTSPFLVNTAGQCYKAGSQLPVYVELDTTQTEWTYYEGFMVQAREVGSGNNTNVGTFSIRGDDELQVLPCYSMTDSAIGHNAHDHWGCKDFLWTPPNNFTGDIQFIGTVVKNQVTFWMDVRSAVVKYSATCEIDSVDQDDSCAASECTRDCDPATTQATETTQATNAAPAGHATSLLGLGLVTGIFSALIHV